jgi:predicted KAP-like P-loop ATPase
MWPDNETDVDLLGFDFLVDELLVLLKEPKLLPVTIGLAGDWGSGKSSVLKMAANQLRSDAEGNFLVVEFSPWRFEDYADVKAALLAAVLGAVTLRAEKETEKGKRDKLLVSAAAAVIRIIGSHFTRRNRRFAIEQVALLSSPFLTGDLEAKQEEALKKLEEETKASCAALRCG